MTTPLTAPQPGLPPAKGPISAALMERLGDRAPHNHLEPVWIPLRDSDPLGLDVQLALYICYELHYRGFAGVDQDWEWNAGLLHLRSQFERNFLAAVRREVGTIDPDDTAEQEMERLSVEPVDAPGRRITSATRAHGNRCVSTSCTDRCTTSKRVTRTLG